MHNNNNNNNTHDSVYSAVIMTTGSLRELTRFILVNVEQRQTSTLRPSHVTWAVSPPVFRQLSSTTTIAIYYYYSARKLILIYRPTEIRRLS